MNHAFIFSRHLGFALECLASHRKGTPFHLSLGSYFRQHKKFGSRDRRRIRALCYSWFRLGYALDSVPKRDQISIAYWVLQEEFQGWENEVLEALGLSSNWPTLTLLDRLEHITEANQWKPENMFPSVDLITDQIDKEQFLNNQLSQPKLWVRPIRREPLNLTDLDIVKHESGAIGLPPGTALDQHKGLRGKVEVQDLSSQMVLSKLTDLNGMTLWDCCSASGGKCLNLLDRFNDLQVVASDVRPSIIENLKDRTRRHKHRIATGIIDAAKSIDELTFYKGSEHISILSNSLDLVLADVPCTGSGTWNRNPEFKYTFTGDLGSYSDLQGQILTNVWQYIKPGGHLLYTTCSVFKQENEDVVSTFLSTTDGNMLEHGYIKGYENDSDSMFYAILKK